MNSKTTQHPVTLTGVLVPDNWRENGDVTGLALLTNDERKYVLHYSDSENGIMPLLRERVTIKGFWDLDLKNTVIVTGFSLISGDIS